MTTMVAARIASCTTSQVVGAVSNTHWQPLSRTLATRRLIPCQTHAIHLCIHWSHCGRGDESCRRAAAPPARDAVTGLQIKGARCTALRTAADREFHQRVVP